MDGGLRHSELILADVSHPLGHDSKSGRPYRNGNVMYEVGISRSRPASLARCCLSAMIRTHSCSTSVPCLISPVDFSDTAKARDEIRVALEERISERRAILDARLALALATLTTTERQVLESFAPYPPPQRFWLQKDHLVYAVSALSAGASRQRPLIVTSGMTSDGGGDLSVEPTMAGYTLALQSRYTYASTSCCGDEASLQMTQRNYLARHWTRRCLTRMVIRRLAREARPNQQLQRTSAAQTSFAPRLPVSRGAVMPDRAKSLTVH